MNDALKRLLALDLSRGPLLILTHDNPDPDSLSSACALRFLLEQKRGLSATVGYSGIVGRAENRAMIELLGLEVEPVEASDLARFSHFALIDAQPQTGNSLSGAQTIDIVIDHHPLRPQTERAAFHDVRSRVGASATILTGYLREAKLTIPTNLATALLYGIRTETQDLARETSEADREAYHYLFPLADPTLLASIARPRLDDDYYAALANALAGARTVANIVVCRVDDVPDPDFVPEMADFFVRRVGTEWSLVQGRFRDRVFLSIRTQREDANAGALMQRILDGFGLGGGHGMRAGGAMGGTMATEEAMATIEQRFVQELGGQGSSLDALVTPALASTKVRF